MRKVGDFQLVNQLLLRLRLVIAKRSDPKKVNW